MKTTPDEILERLDTLERQNRRLRNLGGGLLLGLIVLVSLGAGGEKEPPANLPKEILAIRDNDGVVRTILSAEGLCLYSADGEQVAKLSNLGSYGALTVRSLDEEEAGVCTVVSGAIRLRDEAGEQRLAITASSDLGSAMTLEDVSGQTRVLIALREETASFEILGKEGKSRAFLGTMDFGPQSHTGTLGLFDKSGKRTFTAPALD